MDFLELTKRRYSVRAYKSDPVEDDKLQNILEAARMAPTSSAQKTFQLIVIHTKGKEEELSRICRARWFMQAPIVICICGISSQSWVRRDGRTYSDIDVGIVMDHLVLAATDLGLGTCWVAGFHLEAARDVLHLPDDVEPIIFTPLGYPDDQLMPKNHRPMDELVHYEQW